MNQGKIEVRLLRQSDASDLLEFYTANRAFLEPWEPFRPPEFYTLAGMQAVIAECEAGAVEGLTYSMGIFVPATGELAGRITLSGLTRGVSQSANLGYNLDQRFTGQGYASAAVRYMVRYAFGKLGLHRVAAATLPHNYASIRVLRACGFRQEGLTRRYLFIQGQWQDHFIFALTAEEVI